MIQVTDGDGLNLKSLDAGEERWADARDVKEIRGFEVEGIEERGPGNDA